MFNIFLFTNILTIISVSAFKTSTCSHDQVTSAVASYSSCTVSAIKPLVQSMATNANDPVQESAIDEKCDLFKKSGPLMKCAKDNLGKCFNDENVRNLKLSGQQTSLLSMKCYSDDETEMFEHVDDIFFSWLEMEALNMDKEADKCTIKVVDDTNIAFQHCISNFENEGEEILKDAENDKQRKDLAKNFILKCFDQIENTCFSEREMKFLRTEFETSFDVTMGIMFGMEDLNMNDEKQPSNEASLTGNIIYFQTVIFFVFTFL